MRRLEDKLIEQKDENVKLRTKFEKSRHKYRKKISHLLEKEHVQKRDVLRLSLNCFLARKDARSIAINRGED